MTDCQHCHRSALTFEFSAWHPSGGIVARLRCGFCGRATTTFLSVKEVARRAQHDATLTAWVDDEGEILSTQLKIVST